MPVKTKSKKTTSRKARKKRGDNLWAEYIKWDARFKCQRCGNTERLHAHHIVSKAVHVTRWDVNNGVCLCLRCHLYWAHSKDYFDQREYQKFIEGLCGINIINILRDWKMGKIILKDRRKAKIEDDIIYLENWRKENLEGN